MCKYFRDMAKKEKTSCTRLKIVAIIFAAIALAMGLVAFFTPPPWQIDSSVIAFTGEIFAFVALFFAWEAVDRGIDAKITHGGTEIDLKNPDDPDGE